MATNAVQVAMDYHERTKHHFQRYARSLGYLDWATQPDPFRRFAGAPLVRLPFRASEESCPYEDLYRPGAVPAAPLTRATIASFLELSLAISAWKQSGPSRWALRVNPSSGNLHPTEGYLVLPAIADLHDAPGVYHYAPREHALERRASFSTDDWTRLTKDLPAGTFFAGLSSIHWREAWKYGERAYRYCQHDAGHAIAALSLSAAVHGWRCRALEAMSDADVAALLGLNRAADFAGTEREHPDLLLAVMPEAVKDLPPDLPADAVAAIAESTWSGAANALSRDHVDWPIIDEAAAACEKPATKPLMWPSPQPDRAAPLAPQSRPSAATIIRRRRSAVDMDATTSISAAEFYGMLSRTMPSAARPPFACLGPPVAVYLAIFVHRVRGLTPGIYMLVRREEETGPLRRAMKPDFAWQTPPGCPRDLPLFLMVEGDARRLAMQVSCMQDIAGDGAFSLGMIAGFEENLRRHGAWFYRRLFWETGMIGQVLYLEAEAAGVGGTGIGCFFDDAVHDVLGLSGAAYQSLYHFTIGGPVLDDRLTTLPAYPPDEQPQM